MARSHEYGHAALFFRARKIRRAHPRDQNHVARIGFYELFQRFRRDKRGYLARHPDDRIKAFGRFAHDGIGECPRREKDSHSLN